MKKTTRTEQSTKAGTALKLLLTNLCKEIENESHKIIDQAAKGNMDAMYCVSNGAYEIIHFATMRSEDKMEKRTKKFISLAKAHFPKAQR